MDLKNNVLQLETKKIQIILNNSYIHIKNILSFAICGINKIDNLMKLLIFSMFQKKYTQNPISMTVLKTLITLFVNIKKLVT